MSQQSIANYPDLGVNVNVHLVNGTVLFGYWDGLQWWVGLPDNPDDMPVANDFVSRWTPYTGE